MNLETMFEMQRVLDERIIKEKVLEGQDLLPQKILALQVELGELANEWRGFKYWSNDQAPRREKMLVEYVDCLHFILSIGLTMDFSIKKEYKPIYKRDVLQQFLNLFEAVGNFSYGIANPHYRRIVKVFLGLGEMLGFTWEQIEQAYMDKNKVNHERQASGY